MDGQTTINPKPATSWRKELIMTENGSDKRKVEKHVLPDDYAGRCQEDFLSTYLTFGGKLPDSEVLHKFEHRLPIPNDDDEAEEMYNLSIRDLVKEGVRKLFTTIDDTAKKVLFTGTSFGGDDPDPVEAALVEPTAHLASQQVFDNWRYSERVARGKTVKVADIVAQLVATGKISPDDAEGIETAEQLFAKVGML